MLTLQRRINLISAVRQDDATSVAPAVQRAVIYPFLLEFAHVGQALGLRRPLRPPVSGKFSTWPHDSIMMLNPAVFRVSMSSASPVRHLRSARQSSRQSPMSDSTLTFRQAFVTIDRMLDQARCGHSPAATRGTGPCFDRIRRRPNHVPLRLTQAACRSHSALSTGTLPNEPTLSSRRTANHLVRSEGSSAAYSGTSKASRWQQVSP